MNKFIAIFTCLLLTMSLQANVLVDPGFEAASLGGLPDGPDLGSWQSWGNMPVGNTTVHSGSQSLLLGNLPTPNADGNLRQSYNVTPAAVAWIMSTWVYYDSTEGNNDLATDKFSFNLQTSAGNFDTVVNATDLTDQTWNFVSITNDVDGAATWVKFYAGKQWTADGENGLFYLDDTYLAPVPEPVTFGAFALIGGLFLLRRK